MPYVTREQLDEVAFAIWMQEYVGPLDPENPSLAERLRWHDYNRMKAGWPDYVSRPAYLARAAAAVMALGYSVPDGMAPTSPGEVGEWLRRRWDEVTRWETGPGPGRSAPRSGPTPPDQSQ